MRPAATLIPGSPLFRGVSERPLLVRALWFLLVGWWLSLLWANVASFFAVAVVGLPLAVWMLHRLPFVLSLYRYHG